jgi:GT2 family glycosyltransferase
LNLNQNNQVFFSIVIPTYKRVEILDKNLSFLNQNRQNQFSLHNHFNRAFKQLTYEVIVCDDNYPEVKDKLHKKYNWVKWLEGPRKGPAANRNKGAKNALGRWLIFIDDDCEPIRSLLESYYLIIEEKNQLVIEGKITCPDKINSPFRRQPENTVGTGTLPSGNFAIHKKYFYDVGMFDEEFEIMEDMELSARIKKNGTTICFAEKAEVFHYSQKLPYSYFIWWIKHHKWMILLQNKEEGINTTSNWSFIKSIFRVISIYFKPLIRQTFHLFTKHEPDNWATYWFYKIAGWLLCPIIIANMIFWDAKYWKKSQINSNFNDKV